MLDRRMMLLSERLRALALRKPRFSYDVRGDSHVYDGIVAHYRFTSEEGRAPDLEEVIDHALANDGIVTAIKDPATGRFSYFSGRHYTDQGNALRFAKEQGGSLVYNWNRNAEVEPSGPVATDPGTTAQGLA
jgi:hypothetical protein